MHGSPSCDEHWLDLQAKRMFDIHQYQTMHNFPSKYNTVHELISSTIFQHFLCISEYSVHPNLRIDKAGYENFFLSSLFILFESNQKMQMFKFLDFNSIFQEGYLTIQK